MAPFWIEIEQFVMSVEFALGMTTMAPRILLAQSGSSPDDTVQFELAAGAVGTSRKMNDCSRSDMIVPPISWISETSPALRFSTPTIDPSTS
jgi:hypothetical protein